MYDRLARFVYRAVECILARLASRRALRAEYHRYIDLLRNES